MTAEIPFQGISSSPADRLNQDGALSLAYNLAPDDTAGGLAPIGTPTIIASLPDGATLRYIHKGASYTHWIITTASATYWCEEGETNPTLDDTHLIANANPTDISAVGNMLILAHGHATPVTYHLWREGAYKPLGDRLPDLPLRFSLSSPIPQYSSCDWSIDYYPAEGDGAFSSADADKQQALNNAVWGCVNTAVQRAWEDGRFCHPFFARAALRMYDGTLISHTAPVYLDVNNALSVALWGGTGAMASATLESYRLQVDYDNYESLVATLAQWRDLIVAVDIYVSLPIYSYDSSKDIQGWHGTQGVRMWHANLPAKAVDLEDLPTSFHKVRSLDVHPTGRIENDYSNLVPQDVLPSLTARQAMTDDRHFHQRIAASSLFSYNSRLHLSDIIAFPYAGYNPSTMFCGGSTAMKRIECLVSLSTDYGDSTAGSVFTGLCSVPLDFHVENAGDNARVENDVMLFYPDINAKSMTLRFVSNNSSRTFLINRTLKPHPFLNGAYAWINRNTLLNNTASSATPLAIPDASNPLPMPSTLAISVVNNPLAIDQRPTVSNSHIRALATAARPLSQGQFGQFPLYVFTDEGIWAMEISADGRYTARQPITRDKALSPESITSIDSAVVFASHRGLMLLSGSEATCISDALHTNATPFSIASLPGLSTVAPLAAPATLHPLRQFLTGCRIAYDYNRQRLIVFNPDIQFAYVYSLRTRRWGMTASTLQSLVNSYPQALAIDSAHHVVDLSVDAAYPPQLLVTRPLSVDGTDGFATIDAAICRGDFSRGDVATILYGSRDLHHWHLVRSSVDHILRGFSGSPYRYYRLALPCTLTAEDTIHAASISYNPRLRNQLR